MLVGQKPNRFIDSSDQHYTDDADEMELHTLTQRHYADFEHDTIGENNDLLINAKIPKRHETAWVAQKLSDFE